MADLRTDYRDDILDLTQNTQRKYKMINNDDGTVSFEDLTDYLQVGDSFGSADVNAVNREVNSNLASVIPDTSTDTVVSLFNAMPRNSTRRYFSSGGLGDFPDSEKSTGYHLLEMYKADSADGSYSRILLINNATGNLYSGRCDGTTVVWSKYVLSSGFEYTQNDILLTITEKPTTATAYTVDISGYKKIIVSFNYGYGDSEIIDVDLFDVVNGYSLSLGSYHSAGYYAFLKAGFSKNGTLSISFCQIGGWTFSNITIAGIK